MNGVFAERGTVCARTHQPSQALCTRTRCPSPDALTHVMAAGMPTQPHRPGVAAAK